MSGARRRSKSSWDNKEEAMTRPKDIDSSFHGDTSPKHSTLETNDVFMSDDFSHEPMQPNRNRDRDRDRADRVDRADRDRDRSRERHQSYESGDIKIDSRPSLNRPCKDFASGNCRRGSHCRFLHQESRFRDDRNKDSDSYKRDEEPTPRDYDQDQRRSSGKPPCRFFMRGDCNRNRCKFSHDVIKSEGYEEKSNRNLESWNDLESVSFHNNTGHQDFTHNGVGPNLESNGVFLHMDIKKETDIKNTESGKLLEASRNDAPIDMNPNVGITEQVSQVSSPQKQILANALELLYSLPNSAPISEPIKTKGILSDSHEQGNLIPVKQETVVESKKDENLKNSGKVEEGDEKAMRQFKIVLVEFVKEILKPTWKEGKMSREVYKTIVKKVVEKVSSSIQGVQIPRTQEKIDQYLAFSKSKITKLVEAYVGRLLKA